LDLRKAGEEQDNAIRDLLEFFRRGLPYAISRWLPKENPSFDAFIEEVAQNAVLRVLEKLDTFEGRSQFTTWASKIAVHIALSDLRRKRWETQSLEELLDDEEHPAPPSLLMDPTPDPAVQAEFADLLHRVERVIDEELTDRQRDAITTAIRTGMPMEDLAVLLGTNRNALYKLMHDARLRIKKRLAQEGIRPEDILSTLPPQAIGK
jgi:RNA polymerase sigma-70 factor (ECF subfamily)